MRAVKCSKCQAEMPAQATACPFCKRPVGSAPALKSVAAKPVNLVDASGFGDEPTRVDPRAVAEALKTSMKPDAPTVVRTESSPAVRPAPAVSRPAALPVSTVDPDAADGFGNEVTRADPGAIAEALKSLRPPGASAPPPPRTPTSPRLGTTPSPAPSPARSPTGPRLSSTPPVAPAPARSPTGSRLSPPPPRGPAPAPAAAGRPAAGRPGVPTDPTLPVSRPPVEGGTAVTSARGPQALLDMEGEVTATFAGSRSAPPPRVDPGDFEGVPTVLQAEPASLGAPRGGSLADLVGDVSAPTAPPLPEQLPSAGEVEAALEASGRQVLPAPPQEAAAAPRGKKGLWVALAAGAAVLAVVAGLLATGALSP